MRIKKIIRKIVPYQIRFYLNPLLKFLLHADYRKRALYSKMREREPVNQHMIFYEAYHGDSMTGNAYAVFTYLLHHPKYQQFQHVWAMVDDDSVQPHIKTHPRVRIVTYQSADYVKYLATAKYLLNNTSFPFYFHKRKDQIYINIWHGTPLKTMGMDIKQSGLADHKNIQRNLLFTDYFVSPNKYTYEKLLKSNDVYTLFNGSILDTGYPRVDSMFKANKEKLKEDLNIMDGQKIILYAPTWRGVLGEEENQSQNILNDMRTIQEKCPNKIVLLKAHYYTSEFFKQRGLEHLMVPNSIDTNELLSVVDLLITDYSSIFFEFLPTRNPVIFYAYDEEEYQMKRGTYIPMDKLPGPLCHTMDQVLDSIQHTEEIAKDYADTYEQFVDTFCYHDDGRATERFVDAIFEGKPVKDLFQIENNKTKILMYGGGFLNNGITASVVNLLNIIDYDKFDVTLIDHGTNIKESKKNHMQKLNENVHHIYRFGTWNVTLADLLRHTFFLKTGQKSIAPVKMYEKEMERITGLTVFDIGIDFGGYSPFWAVLFAFGDFQRRSIYFHSNMAEEPNKKVKNRYPHRENLKVIFQLYDLFDKVISVSQLVHEQNYKYIKQFINRAEQKLDYVTNAIDHQRILSMKNQNNDFMYEFGDEFDTRVHSQSKKLYAQIEKSVSSTAGSDMINFITVGRLSPEKDHMKLIQSFYEITKTYPNVRLYIVGEGALRNQLQQQVKKLNIDGKVIFTGQLDNPYPLLSKCDCFILSSNYEGQAIVLLEALILGISVITTDIPGPRSVVEDGYGLIVDNSEEGLISGMQQFLVGDQIKKREFDYVAYQQHSLSMFYNKVCNVQE